MIHRFECFLESREVHADDRAGLNPGLMYLLWKQQKKRCFIWIGGSDWKSWDSLLGGGVGSDGDFEEL